MSSACLNELDPALVDRGVVLGDVDALAPFALVEPRLGLARVELAEPRLDRLSLLCVGVPVSSEVAEADDVVLGDLVGVVETPSRE